MLSKPVNSVLLKINDISNDTVTGYVVSGIGVMVLDGIYDPMQEWFSFMQGAVVKTFTPIRAEKPKKITNNGFARIPDSARRMFDHQVDQYNLPFVEFRNITNKELESIRRAGFVGWDLAEDNQPLTIRTSNMKTEATLWCREHCEGRYKIRSNSVLFQKKDDYLMAVLYLGGK